MAVAEDGSTCGTVGGGIMEARVLELAHRALGDTDFSPRYERLYHRRKAPDETTATTSGLHCAGNQTNLYHLATPDDLSTVADIVDRFQNDRPGMVRIDSSGLTIEEYVPEQIEPPYRFQDGQGWSFTAQLLNWKRVAIIGGGHCGLALSRTMDNLGYTVSVIENRPHVFTFEQNEYATHKIAVDDYADAGSHINYPAWTHVVVMTANRPDDVRGLLGIAEGPYPYIGVMGAPAKLARIRSDLNDLGIGDGAIDGFYAPVGLDMTSNTPEEIAISIAAEILRERQKLFPFTRPAEI